MAVADMKNATLRRIVIVFLIPVLIVLHSLYGLLHGIIAASDEVKDAW